MNTDVVETDVPNIRIIPNTRTTRIARILLVHPTILPALRIRRSRRGPVR